VLAFFDADAVHAALPYARLADRLEEFFREGVTAPLRHHHAVPRSGREDAAFLLMPAWRADRETGVKLVHVCPGNEALGLPTVQAVYVLFDGPSGTPRAVLEGTSLTLRRTAAASALAARFLARRDAARMCMIGAGALAPHLVAAHLATRPIREVLIWNRTPSRGEALAARLREQGIEARFVADREAAVRAADIVSCATTSREPLVLGEWISPGCHVDLVGAFRPDMRESDAALLARARVFVDTRAGALEEAGDIIQAIAAGAIQERDIAGDLYELCRGAVLGRIDPSEVTVFKSVGCAIEDLAAAGLVAGG